MPKINRKKIQDIVEQKDPDVQAICKKHGIGRHDLIHIATTVARTGEMTPKEALIRLEEIDNIAEFIEKIRLRHAFNEAEANKQSS